MIKPEVIKAFRKKYKLTQKELAELAGVSVQTVRLTWERSGITENQAKEAQVIQSLLMFQAVTPM